jgi:ribokinase
MSLMLVAEIPSSAERTLLDFEDALIATTSSGVSFELPLRSPKACLFAATLSAMFSFWVPWHKCSTLQQSGVSIEAVTKVSSPTSTALVMVEHTGENQIVVADGANQHASFDSALVSSADAVIVQFEIPESVIVEVGKAAKGIFCVNAAPVRELSDELASLIDVLIVNEHEFAQLGEPKSGLVIVTAGAKEVVAYQNGEIVAKSQPPKVEALDTVGAGDTFVGAFVVAYASGKTVPDALDLACAASALSTLKLGAQSGMPTASEVKEFFNK